VLANLLSGLGIAASCGVNAYLPLLILALADRFTTVVDLQSPFSALSSPWAIAALLLLLPFELIPDKIPRLDTLSDRVHTVVRLPAGALGMAAVASQADGPHPLVGAVLGGLTAGAVHLFKLQSRPGVTRATAGIANPFVSLVEDAAAVVVSITAALTPLGTLVALPLAGLALWRLYARMSSGPVRIGSIVLPHSRR
jgi:hypothetical protein